MFGYQILGFGSGGVAPTIEGLVVAGGGSGGSGISGWNNGGAGGAGGYRTFCCTLSWCRTDNNGYCW